ncbi:MAG: 16S rRNA (adenine(1518)-N(6)/adenine(1519)-N(6))-dimethyltransferase RsmA [bacterium]|nr:16S rRNA (adenine(1518)-N(6)/adenine(1519)-N(6))-dimethyltransferase RsmA [bacterium]
MIQPLTNPDVLKSVLASHQLRAAKSMGQNFLICGEVIDAVLMGLSIGPKHITELGPGLGTLTQGLIGSGYIVRGIEKDDDFVRVLPKMVPPAFRKNLTVIHGDLLEEDWHWPSQGSASGQAYSLIGNIPYNISGLIIRRLTNIQAVPSLVILLMQKEVAERIVYTENSMSLPGLSVGLWGNAELLLQVPPSCFIPEPAVNSALIQIRPNADMLSLEKREKIIACAKPFFQAKRKQIAHTLKNFYSKNAKEIEFIANKLSISPSARPENLSVETWTALCDILTL